MAEASGQSVRSEGSKRLSENEELDVRLVKKAKNGGELGDRVRKVAEIVLVLATMGKIRGGEVPSGVEMEMMEDARARLVEVSEQFAPKDVFPTQVFGSIIEDLGLDCSRERKLGFQPPKVSIGQRVNITKQKVVSCMILVMIVFVYQCLLIGWNNAMINDPFSFLGSRFIA